MTNPIEISPQAPSAAPQRPVTSQAASAGISFAEQLSQAQEAGLKFSNHAQKRLQSRSIQLPDDGLARLAEAVDKAEKRGGKESLVLMDELAFIVNVPNRVVVTALDARSRGEGVFTQIDSVVIAGREA